jgi:predicted short-subunit dehydrogenase-like oxidoreductase (DUF2520 family)
LCGDGRRDGRNAWKIRNYLFLLNKLKPHTLNIIGAGRVGRALGKLWHDARVFHVQSVLTRGAASAREAAAFIGALGAEETLAAMPPADLWLLATPDGEIARAAQSLAAADVLRAGDVVFHASGALASGELRAAAGAGAHVASVHPLKSFADAADAVRTFAGTYCAAEGDAAALTLLKPAFEHIGARVTAIDPRFKTLYHAASVLVCNDLTALMEAGLQCYEKAGIPRVTAAAMMEPLVRETVDNVFKLGTVKALTGPIARGDGTVVARQQEALREFDPRIAEIYRALGVMAVELSRAQGGADAAALTELAKVLANADKP